VIFAAGGTTAQGALLAAAGAGRRCIAADIVTSTDPAIAGCLLASSLKFIDRGVRLTIADAIAGRWHGGVRTLGLADGAVGLSPLRQALPPGQTERLQRVITMLATGALSTGP